MASDSHAGQNSPTIEVMVNQHKLSVELVATPQTRAIGLSGRKSMPENHGMLFVYRKEKLLSFWMHNTTLPLSIAFLNSGGIILNILDMEPLNTIPRYSSVKPAQFALETNQGWFERQGIRAGDRVHFDIPGSALVD